MHKTTDIIKKIFHGLDNNGSNKDVRTISLLFGICIVTGAMYYYNSNIIPLIGFTILTIIIQAGTYFLFDFMSKKKLIGSVIYILALATTVLLANTLIVFQQSIGVKGLDVEVSFLFWFLTPQSAMPYFPFYTYAMFLIASFFISSTVYYFTMIIYRTTMTFLLMLIPLAIYAKELQEIPLMLILLLFILYFGIMTLNTSRKNFTVVKTLKSLKYYKAISYFLVGSIVIITLIPKPAIVANREYVESVINASELTSKLMGTLNKMNDKSNGGGFLNIQNDKVLFYVDSDEVINLKAKVLEDYDYTDDSWSIDGRYIYTGFDDYSKNLNPKTFISLIEKVCENNQEFADKYNLNDFLETEDVEDCVKNINIKANNFSAEYLLVPTGFIKVPAVNEDKIVITTDGEVGINGVGVFNSNLNYDIEYYSESIVYSDKINKLITQFSSETYKEFLNDLKWEVILSLDKEDKIVFSHYSTYNKAISYYEKTYQEPSEKILKLAQEITKDKYSDYEKAEAIEEYFIANNFIYDLNFRKSKGDNVEDFLFESKTGVCYEYATAMVILARAVGLPARYVEGFSVSNYSKDNGLFVVTPKESHAFPEVYISGYGWMSFEPTVPSDQIDISSPAKKSFMFFMQVMMIIIFIVTIVLCMIFVPKLMELFFRLSLKKYKYGERVVRIFKKLKALFGFSESMTSKEMSEFFINKYGTDFSVSEKIFDKYVYGNAEITELEFDRVYQQYFTLFEDKKVDDKNRKKVKVKSIVKMRG